MKYIFILLAVFILADSLSAQDTLYVQKFRVVRIKTMSGAIIEGEYAKIVNDSIHLSQNYRDYSYSLSAMKSVRVANNDLGDKGAAFGFSFGFGIPLGVAIYEMAADDLIGEPDGFGKGKYFLLGFVTGPACALVGYVIGKAFFFDWQDLNLEKYKKENLKSYLLSNRNEISVGLSIPLKF